jgi:phospholipase D1/2
VERTSDEQGPQQEPRGEDASTNLRSATALEETPAHLTNGHARCRISKHEKSVTEKSTGPHAGEKTGATEKVNGSAIHDKGKKTRGELPFTKQEKEEMEALLEELCGHLGRPLSTQLFFCRRSLARSINSYISNPILGKRRRREQLPVQH